MDPDCNVWQHTDCVIIPEKPTEKISMPTRFLCDLCRVKRADPYVDSLYPIYVQEMACLNFTVLFWLVCVAYCLRAIKMNSYVEVNKVKLQLLG